jgi:8-oxo-dGTP pyrophosphatase MutT (NUDIX family)
MKMELETPPRPPSRDWVSAIRELLANDRFIDQRQTARARYCPQLTYGRHFSPAGPTAKPAAVMILLELQQPTAHWSQSTIPLTVRPLHLADHPGQISLPGGRVESEESFQEAACRELQEELGLCCGTDHILGSLLPLWVFNSGYLLQPFLAIQTAPLEYAPCPHEVSRVIHLPTSLLVQQTQLETLCFSRGQVSWQAGIFKVGQDCVWGATAIILAELAAVLQLSDCPEMPGSLRAGD